MLSFQLDVINSVVSLIIAFVALIVSIIALIYTAKAYLLKSGIQIRGSFSVCSSIYCDDKYIHNIILENLKDRATVIYKIFLKLGHNNYLEVDDFESEPFILKPFEAFYKEYDPVDLYSVGMGKILLNNLLDDKHVKKQMVLSTSEGRYIVKDSTNYWNPISDFFKNYLTAIISPMRSTYKGKSYGSNAKFLVEFKIENGREEVYPVYPRDYEIRKFKNFCLTKEALESKEALEEYLYEKAIEGSLNCLDISVYEMDSWRKEVYEAENKRIITARYYNWFMYYIIGRIGTIISDYRNNKLNKSLKIKSDK